MTRRTHIGKYEILERIAEGGFGVVYKARDPFIKRLVAVKTCSVGDQNLLQRFFREAEIAGNLHHRNITIVHDFGVEGDVAYLVQEYLSGEDLLAKLRNREPLTLAQKLDYLLQAAIGLGHAHAKGVIHRDVKPGNIRVLENGLVKIMDFGIAKLTTSRTQLTQKGMTVGTVGYLSPEQIRDGAADQRSDIFSYGVVAYELLAYRRPFYGRNLADLLPQILDKDPEPLGRVVPDCPPALAALVGRCLEKDPQRRYQAFDEVIAALRPILGAASRAQRALEAERTAMLAVSAGAAVSVDAQQGTAAAAAERPIGTATATGKARPATATAAAPRRSHRPAPPPPVAAAPAEPPPASLPEPAPETGGSSPPSEDTQPVPTLEAADPAAGESAPAAEELARRSAAELEAEAERIARLISKGKLGTALEALEATVERHSLTEEEKALAALGPVEVAPENLESTRRLQRPEPPPEPPGATASPPATSPSVPPPADLPASPAATPAEAAGARPVPLPLLVAGGAALLLLAALIVWWATRSGESQVDVGAQPAPTAAPTPELSVTPATGTLILLAAPWGEVRSVLAADGSAVPVPEVIETPWRIDLPPGTYRAEMALPGSAEAAICEAEVAPGAEAVCRVDLQEVDTTEYFKQAGWWR